MHQFCPPATFGIVEADIYRTNVMHPINFSYVEGASLRFFHLLLLVLDSFLWESIPVQGLLTTHRSSINRLM